ncbi:MAG: hypothetical protein CMJ83_18700, partial [Planctomycetes bacterium]|nr:hypothetical protein [Planctomycetota bacterium]
MDEGVREKRLEELFQLALELATSERADFLERHCGDDIGLRSKLELMLSEDDQDTGSFLDEPVISSSTCSAGNWCSSFLGDASGHPDGSAFLAHPPDPDRIGRYKILERIGEGGMGIVYLAEQTEPVHRKVALKIVKLGMDTHQVVARFEAERQALALMDHPGIATIYDGGATEHGRPFFVMEHVPGVDITEWCDHHRLSIEDRLRLFSEVCEAIQHAHQKGIIHRDLKPGNILVMPGEAGGQPKIIDFGIARATTQRLTDKTLHTRRSEVIGTFHYMSPEQADPMGIDVDSRTDIYSLGVLLYQLVTGVLPFDQETFEGKPYSDVQRLIREQDPLRPSTRIDRLGDTSIDIAKRRATDARTLKSELRGDLDWITLKAMEKERTRRYASASEFAADIQRHLRHEPVLAAPPGEIYRLLKFARRNRSAVTAGILIFLALAGATVGTTLALLEARAARDAERALREVATKARADERKNRTRAEKEAGRAQAVTDFLHGILAEANPRTSLTGDTTVGALLDRAASRIADDLRGQPLAEARARTMLGEAYLNHDDLHKAEAQLRRALAILDDSPEGELEDFSAVLEPLAWTHIRLGRFAGPEPPRDSRRLHSLRGWSDGKTKQVLPRGEG